MSVVILKGRITGTRDGVLEESFCVALNIPLWQVFSASALLTPCWGVGVGRLSVRWNAQRHPRPLPTGVLVVPFLSCGDQQRLQILPNVPLGGKIALLRISTLSVKSWWLWSVCLGNVFIWQVGSLIGKMLRFSLYCGEWAFVKYFQFTAKGVWAFRVSAVIFSPGCCWPLFSGFPAPSVAPDGSTDPLLVGVQQRPIGSIKTLLIRIDYYHSFEIFSLSIGYQQWCCSVMFQIRIKTLSFFLLMIHKVDL